MLLRQPCLRSSILAAIFLAVCLTLVYHRAWPGYDPSAASQKVTVEAPKGTEAADHATSSALDHDIQTKPPQPASADLVRIKGLGTIDCTTGEDGGLPNLICLYEPDTHELVLEHNAIPHMNISSSMTKSGQYFFYDFLDHATYNPNIIPHPYKPETWIIVARRDQSQDDTTIYSAELVCEATFVNETMRCTKSPLQLPIGPTTSFHCKDQYEFFNNVLGPHDARMFHGPDQPYLIYGSPGEHNCLAQWVHDLRRLVNWGTAPVDQSTQLFKWPTLLQRPQPYSVIEKNWIAFWSLTGDMYMHYTISPTRSFAAISPDGSAGPDLAPLATNDAACLARLMPPVELNPTHMPLKWHHQGSNSLSVTMCRRADPACTPTEANTFAFFIWQTKVMALHGMYEPYVMLLRQAAPFDVVGVSAQPIWYAGRGEAGGEWSRGTKMPPDQSQQLFTTAVAWRDQGLTYHGYLDDTLFISFGVEDKRSAMIDVVAADLLANIALCDET